VVKPQIFRRAAYRRVACSRSLQGVGWIAI